MEIESLTFKTEKEYKEFLDYLFSIRDIKYRDFNTKIIVPVDSEIIGIRTPILRDIGKKIAKTSSENFLNFKLSISISNSYYHTLEAWLVNPEDVEKYLASIGMLS